MVLKFGANVHIYPKEAQASKNGEKSKSTERGSPLFIPLQPLPFTCAKSYQISAVSAISNVIYVNRIHYANASNLLAP